MSGWDIERVKTMMAAEPQGIVSKPHICWATDDLSHAIREVERLREWAAELEAELERRTMRTREARTLELEAALDDIEASPEDPLRVQKVAREALAGDRGGARRYGPDAGIEFPDDGGDGGGA